MTQMTKYPSISSPSDTSDLFQAHLLQSRHSSAHCFESFPEGIYLGSPEAQTDQCNLIRYRIDAAYYHALAEIDWNVFVTLKFHDLEFKALSDSAFKKRRQCLWDLGHEVIGDLDLSSNDLQYFWSEEVNSEDEAHLHVLFHRVYPEKCSAEELRRSIQRYIDPSIVQVPPTNLHVDEPPHVQTVRSRDKVVRYVLKVPLFQHEPKVVGHSHKFIRFWKRRMKWRTRLADRTATLIPAVGSKGTYPNTILSAYP
jgi:hypothetical protein